MYMYYSNDNESDQTAQMRLLIYILSYTVAARFWLGVIVRTRVFFTHTHTHTHTQTPLPPDSGLG